MKSRLALFGFVIACLYPVVTLLDRYDLVYLPALMLILMLAAALAVLFSMYSQENTSFNLAPQDFAILAFTVALIISTFRSAYLPTAEISLYRFGAGILFYLILRSLPLSAKEYRWLFFIATGLVLLMSLHAIYQSVSSTGTFYGAPGRRVGHSLYSNRNNLAAHLNMVWFPLTALFLTRRANSRLSYALMLLSALIFVALTVTVSRGGYMSWLIGVLVLLAVWRYSRLSFPVWKFAGLIFICGVIFVSFFSFYGDSLDDSLRAKITGLGITEGRVASVPDDFHQRLTLWKSAVDLFLSEPLTGIGLSNFRYFNWFPGGGSTRFFNYVHNDYLQLAAETGIIGILSFLVFLFFIFRSAVAGIREENESDKILTTGILAGSTAMLIHAGISFHLYMSPLFGLLMLGSAYVSRISAPGVIRSVQFQLRGTVKPVIVAVIIFLLFVTGNRAFNFLAFQVNIAAAGESLKNGDTESALSSIDVAIDLREDIAEVYRLRGETYTYMSNRRGGDVSILIKAEEAYQKALSLTPFLFERYGDLVRLYLENPQLHREETPEKIFNLMKEARVHAPPQPETIRFLSSWFAAAGETHMSQWLSAWQLDVEENAAEPHN